MRILIIEDEEKLAKHLKNGLEQEGYLISYCLYGKAGQEFIELNHEILDLVILDLMLPDKDGVEVCREIRKLGIVVPILMLTAKSTLEDKIIGLDVGADDYLTKPFSLEELLARVRALSRRPKSVLPTELHVGGLSLNSSTGEVFGNGKKVALTLKEFYLLEYFMKHPGQVLNREQILDSLWDINFDSFSNVVDVHVKNLRQKLEEVGCNELMETVRGLGYRFKRRSV